jgi:hypothetical protein
MRRRGKAIAITAVMLGLGVLVGAGIAAKDRIEEAWWIYKLQTGDGKARLYSCTLDNGRSWQELSSEQRRAANRLVAKNAVSAIPILLGVLKTGYLRDDPDWHTWTAGGLEDALVSFGALALPHLLREIKSDNDRFSLVCAELLEQVYYEKILSIPNRACHFIPRNSGGKGWLGESLPTLRVLCRCQNREISQAAADALARVEGERVNASEAR